MIKLMKIIIGGNKYSDHNHNNDNDDDIDVDGDDDDGVESTLSAKLIQHRHHHLVCDFI